MSSWTKSHQMTPLSITREEFDNRILLIFLILMSTLIVLGLFFVDFTKVRYGTNSPSGEDIPNSKVSIRV